jgi:hypothetical protein
MITSLRGLKERGGEGLPPEDLKDVAKGLKDPRNFGLQI